MKLHEVLRHYRTERGLTQQDVADRLGVAKSTYSGYETGRRQPGVEEIKALSKIFGVSGDAIIGNGTESDLFDMRPVPPQGMLPVIGLASCGKGVIASEDILEYVAADASHCNDEHYYLEITGDSMAPVFSDGDLVLVHRQTSVDSGDVGVFIVDGEEGYIKKVKYDAENIDLISYNPYYPPMHFEGPDVLRVYVVGKVLEQKRRAFP